MNLTNEQTTTQKQSRRGQTLAEFALTLPILLLLMFGVIEFARIFQAWITLQNAARTAARYAVTGRWDEDDVIAWIEYTNPGDGEGHPLTGEDLKEDVLDDLVPCTNDDDEAFIRHWGKDCEPGSDDDQGLRADMARLPSIVERARTGAAGLSLKPGDNIVGLQRENGSAFNSETVTDEEPGWFHVWICSSRPPVYKTTLSARYEPSSDRNLRVCEDKEESIAAYDPDPDVEGDEVEAVPGPNQYDAGGPGDAVEIIVFFNHPLITPLGLVDFVQLQARRVMINESFRSTRVVNLPPALAQATYTPSNTPPPSNTPEPSVTPLPSATPSKTPTGAPTETTTPTPAPDCDNVRFLGAEMIGQYLQIRVINENEYAPLFIDKVFVNWEKNMVVYPNMFAESMNLIGSTGPRSAFWEGPDYSEDTLAGNTPSGEGVWSNGNSPYLTRRFDNDATTVWQIKFSNGPANLASYFSLGHFVGTTLWLGTSWGALEPDPDTDCMVELTGYTIPEPEPPSDTPELHCEDFVISWGGFDTNGVVRYTIRNTGYAVGYLQGVNITWNARVLDPPLDPISLDFVSAGGTNAFDTAAIIVWDPYPDITTSPADSSALGGWLVDAVIEPNRMINIWFDFDGTTNRLDQIGYHPSDFNGTLFDLSAPDCYGGAGTVDTPIPTLTPSSTPTRTHTNTPTNTVPPANTSTFTATVEKVDTNTPTVTRTHTNTPELVPTATFTQIGGE